MACASVGCAFGLHSLQASCCDPAARLHTVQEVVTASVSTCCLSVCQRLGIACCWSCRACTIYRRPMSSQIAYYTAGRALWLTPPCALCCRVHMIHEPVPSIRMCSADASDGQAALRRLADSNFATAVAIAVAGEVAGAAGKEPADSELGGRLSLAPVLAAVPHKRPLLLAPHALLTCCFHS